MANGHLDELQKAEIVSKSKLVPSVFIKNITELITGNTFYYRGGRYRQVSLYNLRTHVRMKFMVFPAKLFSSECHRKPKGMVKGLIDATRQQTIS